MSTHDSVTGRRRGESGFALIMAILALMLLTFLGLTMASVSSTELQIGSNHRLTMQAYYNAEAGIEAGKIVLRDVVWDTVLPLVRGGSWTLPTNSMTHPTPQLERNDAWGNASRDWEPDAGGGGCDQNYGHQGYGAVLDTGAGDVEAPYQYKSTILGVALNGTVTLWVRRVIKMNADGSFSDDPTNTKLVLTAEGTAPTLGQFRGGGAGTFARMRDATQLMETTLRREGDSGTACGTRGGQTSQGPEGAGFGCTPVEAAAVGAAVGLGGGIVDTSVK
jgi:hypothetical protein